MKIKKIITYSLIVIIPAVITNKLMSNKNEIKESTEQAKISSEIIPVSTSLVKKEKINSKIKGNGTLKAKSDLVIISETQGKVINLINDKGNWIRRDATIAIVDNEIPFSQYKLAKANFEKAEKDKKRFERLFQENAIPEDQLEKVKLNYVKAEKDYVAAKKVYENTKIKSPINGYINDCFLEEGMVIGQGTEVAEIIDNSLLNISIKLNEKDVFNIKTGDKATVLLDQFDTESIEGTVKSIAIKPDANLMYDMEVEFKNPSPDKIRPGMYAEIIVKKIKSSETLLIDRKALTGSIQNPRVYIVKNNKAELRSIVIGKIFSDKLEVKKGLNEGEKIILSGHINLTDGIKIKEI